MRKKDKGEPNNNGLAIMGLGIAFGLSLLLFINFIDTGVHGRYFDYLLPWIYYTLVIPVIAIIWGAYTQYQNNKPFDTSE